MKYNNLLWRIANDYQAGDGRPTVLPSDRKMTRLVGRALALEYDAAPVDVRSWDVRPAYHDFMIQVWAQLAALQKHYDIIPVEHDPYPCSEDMFDDVYRLHTLQVFTGGNPHPFLSQSENVAFRAVHDLFGHALWGNSFGPTGEFRAFLCHQQMFTPAALPALAVETLYQNAWFNYSPRNEGREPKEREYPTQKVFIPDMRTVAEIIEGL